MAWRDRPYSHDDESPGAGPMIQIGIPIWTKWVRNLILLNLGVFIFDVLLRNAGKPVIVELFSFRPYEATLGLQWWRTLPACGWFLPIRQP